ncbi:Ldh family oxidoreductase [Phyllobacterium salinisoli]|uniref:Ldh family oxidoreductase n=1 Tax=Phyllobacterium salinisoli TaxID=1899321 RepID=A0A368K017_9HYPH|nr:Ldh family oxidoreductase [Phyllobacterium salinisoli]RCS22746.1 Ldh family oxidoreductase [Phyllobacterium salinisoli]
MKHNSTPRKATIVALNDFCRAVLLAAGADAATADAVTRAMLHGSRLGIDSHGVRLLHHYVTVLTEGRVNPRPQMQLSAAFGAVASLDANDGHGALAAYRAMEHAVQLAGQFGIGAVAIRNSSHFGPAGAFAIAAADAGHIGLAVCNSDSFVRLHDGAQRFHGTNPIACAVPVPQSRPWLLDMATSAIPYNRVQLYKSIGQKLPDGVASTAGGEDTNDPQSVEMLAPLGGAFGFKGSGLAGLVEILSAVLSGMKLSFDIAPMAGPDLSTPRGMGAFVLAIRPDAFADRETFQNGMRRYVETLRNSPARAGASVLAPGDREWAKADRREAGGIPIDPETERVFRELSQQFGLSLPFAGHRAE